MLSKPLNNGEFYETHVAYRLVLVHSIVDTLVLSCFVHSYCAIPSDIPFAIQRDALVCAQSDRRHVSLQTYITAVGRCFLWRIRTPNAFVRRHSDSASTSNRYVTCF